MNSDTYAADQAGIEKLRKADIEATLTQDPGALSTLWADDGINLQTPGAPTVGVSALKGFYEKFRSEHPELESWNIHRSLKISKSWRGGRSR